MSLNIVVVEDSTAMQYAVAELVKDLGPFKVIANLRGEMEATAWLAEYPGRWHLAAIDLVLADGSGFNLLHRFRQHPNAGRIVVLSAFATPGITQKCLALGADAVFSKSEAKRFADYVITLHRPAAEEAAPSA